VARKRQQTSAAGASASAAPPPKSAGPSPRASAMLNAMRLVALMSATIVAVVVYEVLQTPIGFWPALIVGLVAGILARAAFVWLERVWLRAAARRAQAQQ
jgi:hypothetical protein